MKIAKVKMTPDLLEVRDEIYTRITGLFQSDILERFAIGEIVSQVRANPRKYGERAVEQLAAAVGVSADLLWACSRVSDTWTEADVRKCIRSGEQSGWLFRWTHLRILSSVSNERRRKLIGRLFKERLSTDELTDLALETPSRSDQDHRWPRSPQAAIVSFGKIAKRYCESIRSRSAGLQTWLESIQESHIPGRDARLVESLNEAIAAQEAAQRELQHWLPLLQQARAEMLQGAEDDSEDELDEEVDAFDLDVPEEVMN